ncbi:FAD-dependent oxidoreductase [Marisediminicola sp. LYQ134]|uniref:FAD-dependent oxidoreductase n=1 Tax=Marisediminicola sp. LYQ134 TaxID=3391061 RepID=UPI00398320F0
MAPQFDFDAIVVGGGPVGTTTALKLAKGGMRVAIFEKRQAATLEQRASTFHPPTLEMLEPLGLAQPLIDQGIVARSYQFRDAKLGKIVELDYAVLENDTPYPFRVQVEQGNLTRAALAALTSEPLVQLHLGSEVLAVRDIDGGYEVDIAGEGAGTHTARYLIGADGSRSVVRETLGVAFTGRTYPDRYLVITTTLPLHEILDDLSVVNYVADPVDWHVLLRNPSGWRVLFPTSPDTPDETLLDPEEVRSQLRRVVPDFDGYPVAHVTLYEIHRKVAATFRVGSTFLVGDAAHVNNPLGGMGMNSGIHDGLLLADVLLDTAAGRADDTALDTWAEQRRHVALSYVGEETEGNWNALRDRDESRRAMQRDAWRALGEDDAARREFLLTSSMIASVPR